MPELASTTPVTPPTLNKMIKPNTKRIGAFSSTEPPHKVASQLKILIPVGIAMTIVAEAPSTLYPDIVSTEEVCACVYACAYVCVHLCL